MVEAVRLGGLVIGSGETRRRSYVAVKKAVAGYAQQIVKLSVVRLQGKVNTSPSTLLIKTSREQSLVPNY